MEILRRVALLAGLLGALWCVAWPEPALVRVRAVDFAKEQQRKPKFTEASRLPLGEFIAHQTKDRLVKVEGAGWEELLRVARGLEAGKTPDAAWLRRANVSGRADALYFRVREAPASDLAGKIGDDHSFTYLALTSGGTTAWLGATFQRPSGMRSDAPAWLAYPLRRHAFWLLLAGLLLYVLLPWPAVALGAAYYSRVRASVLPDLIGVMLTGMFFVLPLLIVSGMSTTGGLLDAEGGWLWLTLILWAFCVFGLAIFFVAARYTARQVRLLPDRLQWVTLAGCRDLPFADIVSVDLGAVRTPRAVTRLGCLVSLFNWRAAGPTLLAASRSDSVLRLTARDGRSFALVLTALHGLGRLLAALRHAGVPMSDEAEKLVRTTTPEPPENVRRRTRVATVVALVLLAITTAIYALGEQQPAKAPRIEAPDAGGPPVTAEQLIEQERLLREMTAARRVMGQALDRYKAAPEKDAPGRSAALKEFEDAKQRFERLKKRFDAAGNTPTAP